MASSIGEAIQSSTTPQELLSVASRLWLPTDADLPSHLRTQLVHHEKRQRWSGQLLDKLGSTMIQSGNKEAMNSFSFTDHLDEHNYHHQQQGDGEYLRHLTRAVWAAALPFQDDTTTDRPEKEGRYLKQALCGLHPLVAQIHEQQQQQQQQHKQEQGDNPLFSSSFCQAVNLLVQRVEQLAPRLALVDAIEIRWAVRGILARTTTTTKTAATTTCELPNLDARVGALPFDIVPCGIDWSALLLLDTSIKEEQGNNNNHHHHYRDELQRHNGSGNNDDIMSLLVQEIPFSFDSITTRTGKQVPERRGTAWLAEDGIGALAYSGKLMQPRPLPSLVRHAMRAVEQRIGIQSVPMGILPVSTVLGGETASSLSSSSSILDSNANWFDCALCNHYPDAEAACKFHTDPELGTFWERHTCVVAAGDSRRFAFRPIPGQTHWDEWDPTASSSRLDNESLNAPAVTHLMAGDIVQMWGTCNDDFHHAVYTSNSRSTRGRISLVMKRAMDRGGNRKGHGLQGQGRRSKRKRNASARR